MNSYHRDIGLVKEWLGAEEIGKPRYAAASDVLRCLVLEKEGGHYFDTDIKPVESLGQNISCASGVYQLMNGFWINKGAIHPSFEYCIMGAHAAHPLYVGANAVYATLHAGMLARIKKACEKNASTSASDSSQVDIVNCTMQATGKILHQFSVEKRIEVAREVRSSFSDVTQIEKGNLAGKVAVSFDRTYGREEPRANSETEVLLKDLADALTAACAAYVPSRVTTLEGLDAKAIEQVKAFIDQQEAKLLELMLEYTRGGLGKHHKTEVKGYLDQSNEKSLKIFLGEKLINKGGHTDYLIQIQELLFRFKHVTENPGAPAALSSVIENVSALCTELRAHKKFATFLTVSENILQSSTLLQVILSQPNSALVKFEMGPGRLRAGGIQFFYGTHEVSRLPGTELPIAGMVATQDGFSGDMLKKSVGETKVFCNLPETFVREFLEFQNGPTPFNFPACAENKNRTVRVCIQSNAAFNEATGKFHPSQWNTLGFASQEAYDAFLDSKVLYAFSGFMHLSRPECLFAAINENTFKYKPGGHISVLSVSAFDMRRLEGVLDDSEMAQIKVHAKMLAKQILTIAEQEGKNPILPPYGQGVFLTGDSPQLSLVKQALVNGMEEAIAEYRGKPLTLFYCGYPEAVCNRFAQANAKVQCVNANGYDLYALARHLDARQLNPLVINASDADGLAFLKQKIGQYWRGHTLFNTTVEEYLALVTTLPLHSIQAAIKADSLQVSCITGAGVVAEASAGAGVETGAAAGAGSGVVKAAMLCEFLDGLNGAHSAVVAEEAKGDVSGGPAPGGAHPRSPWMAVTHVNVPAPAPAPA